MKTRIVRIMNEIGRKIKDKLCEIYRSDNFRIAFLPYKRSMWNSMQSVYEECVNSGIETYCMAMPYIRKAGRRMPEILDKDTFENAIDIDRLPELKTDFVVIHYPYDGNNTVTSMIPKYYTAELKKYGQVVYIPYSCTNMRQLRVQPGIANVDYAFVGSETEAEEFVREWAELGVDFSGRVFGLGSPKMDAAAKLETGSGTTVIINSLGPFLTAPFYKLEAYRANVISEIHEGRKVIFRPHPLLRQTIRALRPDTEAEYDKLLEDIKAAGGIVDETEYLEETLGMADYMIADPSSVVQMWQSTGRRCRII